MRLTQPVLVLLVLTASPLCADNWPAWRGADGTGVSQERNLPTHWSTTENIRWKVSLPEPGNSTPIVWGDHLFLTQGLDGGKRRAVIALNRKTGAKLWQRELPCSVEETSHRQNPPCSEFLLDYEEDDSSSSSSSSSSSKKKSKKKKPWRLCWPDEFRDEVLARLLSLNEQCHQKELLAGGSTVGNGRQAKERKPEKNDSKQLKLRIKE